MKRLIGLAMTVLVAASSTFASGGISITISGNQGQIKTTGQEFRYSQSPRDLAGGQPGNLTAADHLKETVNLVWRKCNENHS